VVLTDGERTDGANWTVNLISYMTIYLFIYLFVYLFICLYIYLLA